jgi:hypothetical protein
LPLVHIDLESDTRSHGKRYSQIGHDQTMEEKRKKDSKYIDELEDLEEQAEGVFTVDPETRDRIMKELDLDLTPEGRRKILKQD